VSDCPLVRLAIIIKLLKQFEQTGQVVTPPTNRVRFLGAAAFMNRDGHQEIYFAIVEGRSAFGKTPFKKKPAPRRQDLFNKEAYLCHISKTQ
jgi:hypothetical protein